MNQTYIDFERISKALAKTMDVIQGEGNYSEQVWQNLQYAQDDWSKALSYSSSCRTKME